MGKTILTQRQRTLLDRISAEPLLVRSFVLSGGTALAEYYLHHRLSEDLDFFTQNEIDVQYLQTFFSSVKQSIGFESVEYNQSFNGGAQTKSANQI